MLRHPARRRLEQGNGELWHRRIVAAGCRGRHSGGPRAVLHYPGVVTPPPKTCASCGRTLEWRAAWTKNWDEVRYCSDRCRKRRLTPVDTALEVAIDALLDLRPRGASICPSEAARSVDPDRWRELMEPARAAARRLVAAGAVEITQGGRVVDPSTCKGPIRIRRAGC
jgi:hypothetical protein